MHRENISKTKTDLKSARIVYNVNIPLCLLFAYNRLLVFNQQGLNYTVDDFDFETKVARVHRDAKAYYYTQPLSSLR